MDLKAMTIDTYDKSAHFFAKRYSTFPVRTAHIERTLALLSSRERVRAFEIGCGYGRDGAAIAERVDWYHGIDASKAFIDMATKGYPRLRFEVADVEAYDFPPDLDAVFAFASLLHVSPDALRDVFRRAHDAMAEGGVLFASFQLGKGEDARNEPTGMRLFHLYEPARVLELAGNGFEQAHVRRYVETNGKDWFEIVLRKK